MTSLLLLDLDGTVRRTASGETFINTPLDQVIIPEAAAALERFANIGSVIVGCSNQGGVANGYKTIGQCIDEQLETMRMAPQIQAVFFCPDADGARCFLVKPDGSVLTLGIDSLPDLHIRSFRKPKCGMLLLAMARYNATPEMSLYVGDRDEDRTAAISAGVPYIDERGWWDSYPAGTEPRTPEPTVETEGTSVTTVEEVSFESLIGKHMLSGVDLTNRLEKVYEWSSLEPCEVCNFVLDGQTYTALENPEDGYRSSMKHLVKSCEPVSNNFTPIEVECRHLTRGYREYSNGEDNILAFYDCANGKMILAVGTHDADDYYPTFVSDWNPANLSVNDANNS